MGVSTNVYVMYGYMIPYNDAFSEAYEEVYDKEGCPNVLMDSMGGKYMVLGVELFDSGDARYGYETYEGPKGYTIGDLENAFYGYRENFREFFPQFAKIVADYPSLHMFTHYS